MEYIDGLPVIYLDINTELTDESGVNAISFADSPATKNLWLTYSTDEHKFAEIRNEEKRMITAPVMLADTAIIRYDKSVGKFWTKFKPESVQKMMVKYFMQNKINNINEMHSGTRVVDNVYMIESYLVGDKVSSNVYPDAPAGSWIATFYIDDQKYWDEKIKTGEFKGISLEGDFIKYTEEYQYAAIEMLLSNTDLSEDELYNQIKNILG